MKRYTFLLLAFFLSVPAYANGIGSVGSMGVTAAPITNANTSEPDIRDRTPAASKDAVKKTSSKTITEMSNISESTDKAKQPEMETKVKTKTSRVSSVSCKTYEGKVFDQGDAGYNDCISTIKNNRQGAKTVP